MTTDGHRAYLEAVEGAFGADIDYAMLVKIYGEPVGALADAQDAALLASDGGWTVADLVDDG